MNIKSCKAPYVVKYYGKTKREDCIIILAVWIGTELILGILGANSKYIQGAEDYFQGLVEINALFLGSKGASLL